eukprot:CAMPEP_0113460230 /NCGR_PEP_ID=MMETSP0014_2-20120614/10875_1 /TAXON_ID=2857 /ORGANISM="Nitzschia sp." /LENGTH=230 /DNA_ID=CAMNT_0000351867 /DNA_START=906 /DNA_END=1595 /DNA_ORIENTATION=- /assembly_acc=CAM_ASM_000159
MTMTIVVLAMTMMVQPVHSEYEVPTKKAVPPIMDPIPTLPVITDRVYFDITMDGEELGRIVFGLFGTEAPKAVENFVGLSKCDQKKHGRKADVSGADMCYKNSKIHRVIPNFMLQGGDYTHNDGTGGECIFEGQEFFDDESFAVKHNRRYLLSMANSGRPNTNRSQWFINTVKTQWLDGKNVVFGMVLEGKRVITEIEKVGTHGGRPRAEIIIVESGSLPLEPEDSTPRL